MTEGDAGPVAALSARVFRQTFVDEFALPYHPDDIEPFLAKRHGPASMLAWLNDPAMSLWVAEHGGAIAGYAALGPMSMPHPDASAGDGELYRLYVGREHHGGGVAADLMDLAMDWLNARPAQWIGVWSGNIRAQRFYARYGFSKVGEYDYPVGRTIDREFILKR